MLGFTFRNVMFITNNKLGICLDFNHNTENRKYK